MYSDELYFFIHVVVPEVCGIMHLPKPHFRTVSIIYQYQIFNF